MVTNIAADKGYLSKDMADIVISVLSMVLVSECFVNALVYIFKLPGLKQAIMPKGLFHSHVIQTTVAQHNTTAKW
jgi:hypothetical protein